MTEPTTPQPDRSDDMALVKDPELEGLFAITGTEPGPRGYDPMLPAVTARISRRRRNRRAGIAAGAAAAVLVAGAATARMVGDDPDQDLASDTSNPGLTITYGHHVYTFTGFTDVGCETRSGHEVLQARFSPQNAMDGNNLVAPILSFEARPDLVSAHPPTFNLPESAGDSENNAFTLFAAVPVGSGTSGDDNEASSQEEEAIGTVTITDLTCGSHPTFTITADAELGSEVSGPTIPINGRIIYPAPH